MITVRIPRWHGQESVAAGAPGIPGVPAPNASNLVILAAQDFTAEPVARVHLPARIPLGFHGSWLADQ